jgi:hypothetical protein
MRGSGSGRTTSASSKSSHRHGCGQYNRLPETSAIRLLNNNNAFVCRRSVSTKSRVHEFFTYFHYLRMRSARVKDLVATLTADWCRMSQRPDQSPVESEPAKNQFGWL